MTIKPPSSFFQHTSIVRGEVIQEGNNRRTQEFGGVVVIWLCVPSDLGEGPGRGSECVCVCVCVEVSERLRREERREMMLIVH
jgi:hypothetical protein